MFVCVCVCVCVRLTVGERWECPCRLRLLLVPAVGPSRPPPFADDRCNPSAFVPNPRKQMREAQFRDLVHPMSIAAKVKITFSS